MWDTTAGGMTMLRIFWTAVRRFDPSAAGERRMAGTAEGDIAERFEPRRSASRSRAAALAARADYAGFDDFWEPFTFAVGPAGGYLRGASAERQASLREACREALPDGPFSLDARAWFARGTAP